MWPFTLWFRSRKAHVGSIGPHCPLHSQPRALSDAYQPDQQRTVAATFERFGTNAMGYFVGDFLSEITFKPKENLTIRIAIGYR